MAEIALSHALVNPIPLSLGLHGTLEWALRVVLGLLLCVRITLRVSPSFTTSMLKSLPR